MVELARLRAKERDEERIELQDEINNYWVEDSDKDLRINSLYALLNDFDHQLKRVMLSGFLMGPHTSYSYEEFNKK